MNECVSVTEVLTLDNSNNTHNSLEIYIKENLYLFENRTHVWMYVAVTNSLRIDFKRNPFQNLERKHLNKQNCFVLKNSRQKFL